MERRIRDDLAESQQHMLELIDNHRDKLSGVVQQVADQLADLSVEPKSRLVSTTSHSSSLSEHAADLSEELARVMTKIPNPIIRQRFEAAAKAALESHLVTIIDEEPVSQQAVWSPRRGAFLASSEVARHSSINNNTSNKWAVQRSVGPTAKESSRKRARVRCPARSIVSIKDFFGGRIYMQTDVYQVATGLCSKSDTLHNNYLLEHETSFVYYPAPWCLRMCFNFGVNVLVTKQPRDGNGKYKPFELSPLIR
ncbi:hypothetical protein GJ744_004397 [Endocarpon pusillum]|uniref:Uncharacterized protein n=1 Tax=Endocarpon pusillum TaxID=364733 RepID=A0A8H7AW99_9EURO|nr:hypothetical protein GJ744_004397 [Endocarpon pusillum]